MKICLINPPISHFWKNEKPKNIGVESFFFSVPLGILYIAAVLRKEGHEVTVLDCVMNADVVPAWYDEGNEVTYGLSLDEIKSRLQRISPDIIGLSCQFTTYANNIPRVGRAVKEACPDIPLVLGGPHASVADKEVLSTTNDVDIIVRGEGEDIIVELMRYFEGQASLRDIQGITYRENGSIVRNPQPKVIQDLDRIPFPAYDLIDMDGYLGRGKNRIKSRVGESGKPFISMITSRGCPYNCVFCSIHLTMGKRWRGHSADYVIKHLKFLKDNYGVDNFHFEDDSILQDKTRFISILNLMLDNNLKIDWDTPNGVRADHLNKELLQLMRKCGCVSIAIGIESGSQRVLNEVIKKKISLGTVETVAKTCLEVGMPVSGFLVIGFPGETKKDIEDTVKFGLHLAKEYKTRISGAMIATPLIGTELYEICKKNNLFGRKPIPKSFYNATGKEADGMIYTVDFTPADLKKINHYFVKKAYSLMLWRTFSHPSEFIKLVKNIGSFNNALLYFKRLIGIN